MGSGTSSLTIFGFTLVGLAFLTLILLTVSLAILARAKALRAQTSENLLSTLLENLPVALFGKDYQNDLRFFVWNKKATELWGLTADQVIGKSDSDFFPKEQADFFRKKDLETLMEQKTVEILEEPITTPHRGKRILHTTKVPILDHSGKPRYLIGISEDITDLKAAEKLIASQRLKIAHSEKLAALGEMAGGMAHEINNPLTAIQLNSQILVSMIEDKQINEARLLKIGKDISSTVHRIASVIRKLLEFSRDAEHEKTETVPMNSILKDTVGFCAARFQAHQVELQVPEVASDLSIECRRLQISHALLDLINNAFEASLKTQTPFVRIEVKDLGSETEIAITDSGNGIPHEIAQKMDQPFFTTKEVGQGTGLGLSSSIGIVRSHGGELFLDDSSAHTRFVVRLPKKQSSNPG